MSDDTTVIVIRIKTGEDILAILLGEDDTHMKVQHPYFVKYGASENHILMVPYCPLTDESFYNIAHDRIEFIAVAREDVTTKYLRNLIDLVIPQSDEVTELTGTYTTGTYLEGNNTKH